MADPPVPSTHPPKQLFMVADASRARKLAAPELPAGHQLRGIRPGDRSAWIELLAASGVDEWTVEKFDAYTAEPERLAGSRAVECDGRLVAAAFASQRSRDPLAGALDYVVCHPEHQGRRLGLIVCAAVIEHLADQGYATISLQTDDWRLAAIKTYFNLGFEPVMTRADMPGRWLKVRQQLHLT